jgi:hypothetical protein
MFEQSKTAISILMRRGAKWRLPYSPFLSIYRRSGNVLRSARDLPDLLFAAQCYHRPKYDAEPVVQVLRENGTRMSCVTN